MSIDNKILKKIRKGIGHGGIKTLTERLGKPRASVSAVMNGKYFNKEIIDAAIRLANERQRETIENEKRLKEAIV